MVAWGVSGPGARFRADPAWCVAFVWARLDTQPELERQLAPKRPAREREQHHHESQQEHHEGSVIRVRVGAPPDDDVREARRGHGQHRDRVCVRDITNLGSLAREPSPIPPAGQDRQTEEYLPDHEHEGPSTVELPGGRDGRPDD